jgi:UDP-N-acetylglucosamine--N-acetylmuramyl-(pentapeptide) pyrophosphoryl-undecaprenol N-acetylglucosamine transferase
MSQPILLAAGGTGGHVYPALAVAEYLREHQPATPLHFVGAVGGFERPLIERSGITFDGYHEVYSGPLHGVKPAVATQSVGKLSFGTTQALRLLRRIRPYVILTTGGWVSVPVAVAAQILRIPVVIYLPDIEPALTIKTLRPLARRICVTTPASAPYFSLTKMVVTGYPLRKTMLQATKADAMAHFNLDPIRKTLLVFGGSRGARSINTAVIAILPELLRQQVQIIHVTGELDWPQAEPHQNTPHYHPFAYLHDDMGLAMAAADLVVCRSGASTLGELPYFGLPSILVPYPYAWRYQKVNADYLVEHKAGVMMEDSRMTTDLLPALVTLLRDESHLRQMRAAASALAQPNATEKIVNTLNLFARDAQT